MMECVLECKFKWCKHFVDPDCCRNGECVATTKELLTYKQYWEDENDRQFIERLRKQRSEL